MHETAARLIVRGDSLNPVEVTDLLGCEPDRAWKKGDLRKLIAGAQPTKRPTGLWTLKAARRNPGDLDGQINDLLSNVTDNPLIWRELSERFEVLVFCGLFMKGSNERCLLSPHTLDGLGRRQISLDFDIYDGGDDDWNTTFDLEKLLYDALLPGERQIKVAMLIARAFDGDEIPSDFRVNAALDVLVNRADIEAFGFTHQWRASEIRRKAP